MQTSPPTPSSDQCHKINPYHIPKEKGCGQNNSCPYKTKPPNMIRGDFNAGDITISYTDIKCALCGRELKEICPPPPPPPWLTWLKKNWFIPVGVLALLALLIWLIIRQPEKKIDPPCDGKVQGDTCVSNTKYEKVCDKNGGYRLGKPLGKCGPPPPPCEAGTSAGDTCDLVNHILYERVCDGNGGYQFGKILKRKSVECRYTPPPRPPRNGYGPVIPGNPPKRYLYKDGVVVGTDYL